MNCLTAKMHVQKLKLDLPSVPKECCACCNTLCDLKMWQAAANAKDSKATSNMHGKVNKATENSGQSTKSADHWKAMANALMQSLAGSNEKGACFDCGEMGYFAKDCPEPKKEVGRHNPKIKGKYHNNQQKFDGKPKVNQKSGPPPPKEGDIEIQIINGVKKCWCAKCNCWSPSNGTDQHGNTKPAQNQANAASQVSFNHHPMCFKATCTPETKWCVMTKEDSNTTTKSGQSIMQTPLSVMMSICHLTLIGHSQGGTTKAINSLISNATSVAKAAQWIGINAARGSHWSISSTWETVLENETLYFMAIIAGQQDLEHSKHSALASRTPTSKATVAGPEKVSKSNICASRKG